MKLFEELKRFSAQNNEKLDFHDFNLFDLLNSSEPYLTWAVLVTKAQTSCVCELFLMLISN